MRGFVHLTTGKIGLHDIFRVDNNPLGGFMQGGVQVRKHSRRPEYRVALQCGITCADTEVKRCAYGFVSRAQRFSEIRPPNAN